MSKEIPNNIIELLENQNFNALGSDEKKQVSSQLTENDYSLMRNFIWQSKKSLKVKPEGLTANASTPDFLADKFQQKYQKTGLFSKLGSLLDYNIPVYKVGLVGAAMMAIFMITQRGTNEYTNQFVNEIPSYQEQFSDSNIYESKGTADSFSTDAVAGEGLDGIIDLADSLQGNSLENDSVLQKVLEMQF